MYILDTRLTQDQGRQVIETLRSLLPPGTFIRQSPLAPQPPLKHGKPGQDSTLQDKGRVGGMLLIVSSKWSKGIKDW